MKRLLILSGKGGTGKTTVAAAFISFSRAGAVADCDVDAPNLHLLKRPAGTPLVSDFLGGDKALVDRSKCTGCGLCLDYCRFGAISLTGGVCAVNEYACEGCGVCAHVCPEKAVCLKTDVAGRKELYLEEGVFSTATLKMGRGNSGKLVADVKMAMLKNAREAELAVVDGSPGIGCPVIASASGMDFILAVAEPSLSGLSDLKRLVKTARSFQAGIGVCVNKWDVSPEHTGAVAAFCEEAGIPFLGKIPYDKRASGAINSGGSLADTEGPARDALMEIYKKTMKILNQ